KIQQLKVRELEEEPKGTFIAFVDDNEASFDVALTIENNDLKQHSCDCHLKDLVCIHQLAVLFYLTNQAVSVKKVRTTKKAPKLTEAQNLLQQLDLQDVKGWLHQFFIANKEAEIQFLLAFSKKD